MKPENGSAQSRRLIGAVFTWKTWLAMLFLAVLLIAQDQMRGNPSPQMDRSVVVDAAAQDALRVSDETRMRVFLTGYSYWDNTPPQSAAIARPVLHDEAGGAGTYEDPVTLAVGHRYVDQAFVPDYPPGTRFYFPMLRKYAVVEDLCGDGFEPQLGPCHIGHNGHPWLDLYIGGVGHDAARADACTRSITGIQPAMMHPRPFYPTQAGPVMDTICNEDPDRADRSRSAMEGRR